MKLLIVPMYFPPAGGGGVQRPLKLAEHLPGLGIETHVLAPDDPKWINTDDDLQPPTQAWIHRAHYAGPRGGRPADALHGKTGVERLSTQARLFGRRLLVPDENVTWALTAIPAAVRIVREEGIDVVLTTSPPGSVHLVGAAVQRLTGARWVADLRDSLLAHPHRRADSVALKAKERTRHAVARLVARRADAIVAAAEAIAEETRTLRPKAPVVTIENGCDFDDFAGLEHSPSERFRITHAGSFFGRRDPRPFLSALAGSGLDICARFVGDFRPADREWAESLGLGDRLELKPFVPRRQSLALQRDSEALLLLIPEADGRGKGVLSGKVFEYLAAERPILAVVPPAGAAAALITETGAGLVAAPDDEAGIAAALKDLHDRWRAGTLDGPPLTPELRARLDRRARVQELADLLHGLVRLTRFLFLATIFSVTFEKVHWAVAGQVSLADLLAIGFIVSFSADRIARSDLRVPRTSIVAGAFLVAFLVVYLVGYFSIETAVAATQYGKGLTKFVIHFLFLIMGVAYLARAARAFYWQAFGAFTAGMVFNSAYGLVQLLVARSGKDLDKTLLSPITGGASSINIYGAVDGANIYRPNALTGDPNHLGVMLVIPIIALLPVYLRLERGHRLKLPLAITLGFLFFVELTTLSRSGLLGLIVGLLVLALPYHRLFFSRAFLLPLAGVVSVLAVVVLSRLDYFERVIRSRVQTGGNASSAHFDVYGFVPDILRTDPLFGLGLNNFSVYYESVTGKTNWGPHSFFVAVLVETGLVGAALFACFIAYLFMRLWTARRVGHALAAREDVAAARVIPFSWGLIAALAGTLAANLFYLTMSFYYVYVLAVFCLALPVVFGRELRVRRAPRPAVKAQPAPIRS